MDRVTGSRVKLHLLLKGKEQGMPLKNEFRVTEPAPGTQEVKRSGLVKERPSKCVAACETMEKTGGLRASTPLIKLKKKRIEKKKANLPAGAWRPRAGG